jgi:hypothetical protein
VQIILSEGQLAAPDRLGNVPALQWHHLGVATSRLLAEMEGRQARSRPAQEAETYCDGLVWCLTVGEAASLPASYALGRLVRILRPVQVKILLYAEPAAAGSRSEGSSGPPGEDISSREHGISEERSDLCQELSEAVLPGLPLEVLVAEQEFDPQAGAAAPRKGEGTPAGLYARLASSLKAAAGQKRAAAARQ